ncbi:unnamed protein product [Paramecium pentaurelia]|uniref:Uncharacterized protein n=1 Tax=Paramecium pentaurelia TaxID=43138 RepID=A0A8S1XXZ6_9CILI|nr:unnamed protein product [Paramecium pentaurelia]
MNRFKSKYKLPPKMKTQPIDPRVSYYEVKLQELSSEPSQKYKVQQSTSLTHEGFVRQRKTISDYNKLPTPLPKIQTVRKYNEEYRSIFSQRNLTRLVGGLQQLL